MRSVYLVLLFTALATALEWNDLRMRFSFSDPTRNNSFFEIPRTSKDAVAGGWTKVIGINSHKVSAYCYQNDPRVCILLDSYGHICGIQIGVLVSDLANKGIPFNMSSHSEFRRKTILGKEIWTTTVYTVDPELIDAGGRSEMKGLTGGDSGEIWIEKANGYMLIPKTPEALTRTTKYVLGACIPMMGIHYQYNLSHDLRCADFFPFFLLYKDNQLIGFSFQTFGTATTEGREWYDDVPSEALLGAINPEFLPRCLAKWATDYKAILLHVYFVEKPWEITCP